MANVYTIRLWQVVQAPIDFPPLGPTVPTGFKWVVRDVRMVNDTQGLAILSPAILKVHNGATIFRTPPGCTMGDVFYQWEGRAVLEAGELLEVSLPDTGWTVAVDGWQLTLP